MKKLFVFAIAAIFVLFAVSSCQKEDKIANVVKAEGISISPASLTLQHHAFAELTAVLVPDNATSKAVTWATKDKNIATVTSQGLVEGKNVGTTTITATTSDGKFTAECPVTVTAVPVESVSLNKDSVELVEDEAITLVATVSPGTASNQAVTWTTDKPDIAIVDATGKVTAKSKGQANITATTVDGGKTATCVVNVKVRVPDHVEVVEIWKKDVAGYRAILGDETDKTEAFLTYSAKDKVVTWEANTTGKPRTATIEFTNGSKLTVTQVEVKDFAGSWTITTKLFASNKNLGFTANSNAQVIPLTIGTTTQGTTANDGSKDITNNLTVAGLVKTYVAEAYAEVDYDAKSYRFGIFFNGNKAQAVNTGKAGYDYLVMLPELGSGWTSYNFCPFPFNGGTNYGWLWFTVDDLSNMHYGKADWRKMDGKDVLGMSFCACKSATPTAADFASVNSTSYDVIHQCNVNTADNPGFLLVRN